MVLPRSGELSLGLYRMRAIESREGSKGVLEGEVDRVGVGCRWLRRSTLSLQGRERRERVLGPIGWEAVGTVEGAERDPLVVVQAVGQIVDRPQLAAAVAAHSFVLLSFLVCLVHVLLCLYLATDLRAAAVAAAAGNWGVDHLRA